MNSLSGHVAVVTGASSGIGQAVALQLADRGVVLCLLGRDLSALNRTAQACVQRGAGVYCYPTDLREATQVQEAVLKMESDCGRVDILIHSAGVIAMGEMESADWHDLDLQLEVNVRAPYMLTQRLLVSLKRNGGQIVFVNSSAGVAARRNVGQYAASKHALKAIADSLREEVNGFGIRVLSIYPGRTATPMQQAIHGMEGKEYRPDALLQPADVAQMVVHALSLPRSAEVTDIHIRPMMKPPVAG